MWSAKNTTAGAVVRAAAATHCGGGDERMRAAAAAAHCGGGDERMRAAATHCDGGDERMRAAAAALVSDKCDERPGVWKNDCETEDTHFCAYMQYAPHLRGLTTSIPTPSSTPTVSPRTLPSHPSYPDAILYPGGQERTLPRMPPPCSLLVLRKKVKVAHYRG